MVGMWSSTSNHLVPIISIASTDMRFLVCNWAKFKVLVLTFKALHGLGPCSLSECLSLKISTYPTQISSMGMHRVATPGEAQKSTTHNQAFSVVATSLWNSLPPEVWLAPSLLRFRSQPKTWLFSQVFL